MFMPADPTMLNASASPVERPMTPARTADSIEQLEKKLLKLRDEWKAQRGHEPSTKKLVLYPAYQQIIGMGPVAVPCLLRELDTNLDNWFSALMSITGADPVPAQDRGDGKAMAQA